LKKNIFKNFEIPIAIFSKIKFQILKLVTFLNGATEIFKTLGFQKYF